MLTNTTVVLCVSGLLLNDEKIPGKIIVPCYGYERDTIVYALAI